jgi:hypothetical protein
LLDENVDLDQLKSYPIVLLPNVGILSAREVDLLKRYVEQGGNLIVTGHSGLSGSRGEPLAASTIAELQGATLVERLDSLDNHVRFPVAEVFRGDLPGDWPFLVKGPAAVFQPTTAQPIGELLKPHRTVRQRQGKEGTDWPMSADAPVGPAILLNQYGQGRVLTLACSPDFSTASEHALVETRQLLRNAVRRLHPQPAVEIEAPAGVETVVSDDPAARILRVHLLAYHSPPQTIPVRERPFVLPALIEDAPLYRAVIRVRRPIREVRAHNADTELKQDAGRIAVTVNDIHEVVAISY